MANGDREVATVRQLAWPLVCIVGPTASGKSEVAQLVAERIGAEILSADSMQIYRGMDIGTGKVPGCDRHVVHHGLDIVDPTDSYSASLFQDYARDCVDRLTDEGKRCVVCGGTGFYVRALIDDYDFPAGEQVGNPVRDRYNALIDKHGSQAVWEMLNAADPESASVIHPNESKRIVRAFELLAVGSSYRVQKDALDYLPQYYPAYLYGLSVEPDVLRERIDARIDGMFEAGFVQEVRNLINTGMLSSTTSLQAIGYREVVAFLEGDMSLDEAQSRMKIATHQYAKRQRIWFRKDKRISWIDANDGDANRIARIIVNNFESRMNG